MIRLESKYETFKEYYGTDYTHVFSGTCIFSMAGCICRSMNFLHRISFKQVGCELDFFPLDDKKNKKQQNN